MQKMAVAQGVAHQGMQRRLPGALAEAGVVKPEHRTASPTEELDIIEMRRQIARRAGTKQHHRSLWRDWVGAGGAQRVAACSASARHSPWRDWVGAGRSPWRDWVGAGRSPSLLPAYGYWLSNWRKPKPAQRPSLGIGEDDRLRIEAEVRGYLVAIPIREEDHSVEQAVQHWNR